MEHSEIKRIIRDCRKKTRIEYVNKGRFFTPKLKSINHLEVGYSKIISGPMDIFLELLYLLKKKIKDFFERLKNRLFPKKDKIYGKNRDSSINGKLTFAKPENKAKPIHHIKVELWARTWLLQWRKFGDGISDREGHYTVAYDLEEAKKWKYIKLHLELYQTTHIFFKDDKPEPQYELFQKVAVRKDQIRVKSFMMEDIRMFYWEYRDDFPTARVVIKNHDKDAPQYYTEGRMDAASEQIIPFELIKVKHLKQIRRNPESISLASIQNDYPLNLTQCIEKVLPGFTRSDIYFGNRMMNGMNRGDFLPDKDNPNHYWIKYFGACNYEINNIYAFPDVEIKFELRPNGLPLPIEIHTTGPLNAYEKDRWKKQVFTPSDAKTWEYAKRIARINGGASTEIDEHFTGTHLNAEQYAIAAYRNLRLNPVASLLLPHLKEVVLINHSADSILLRDFLPKANALTLNGIKKRVADLLGVQDWKGFHPMKPISNAHDMAHADRLFWDTTKKFVDGFIDENLDEIKKYWFEIYCFSTDLVEHSVKVFLSDVDLEKLSPNEKKQALDRMEYYSFSYIFDSKLKRELVNGELKVISPITKNDGSKPISAEDIQNLKESCCYMIFVATYLHTWINEHQYDDIGEVLYNCMGLRFGDGENGVLAPESDLRIAPDLTRATQGLWFANLLSRTEYGFITRNEDGDVNPVFSKMLLDLKDEFLDVDIEIQNIESRTNI